MKSFHLHDNISRTDPGMAVEVDGLASVSVQVTGTFVAIITWQGTIDGTNWISLPAVNLATRAVSTWTTQAGIYVIPVLGLRLFRATLVWTSGTSLKAIGYGSTLPLSLNTEGMQRLPRELELTIVDGEPVSGMVDVSGYTMFSVFVPTGTEGTHLQVLEDYDGTAKSCKDDLPALKIVPFTADQWVDLPAAAATAHQMYLKTCSAIDGTAQAQTGAATLILRCKG